MQGEEVNRKMPKAADGTFHLVGNVVEFQVEENFKAEPGHFTDELGTVAAEEGQPDLHPLEFPIERFEKGEGFLPGGEIQGDNQFTPLLHGGYWGIISPCSAMKREVGDKRHEGSGSFFPGKG